MIVTNSPFVLATSTAAADPLRNTRVGWQTWLRDLQAAAITASTETAEGPKDMPLRPDTATYWLPATLPATLIADLGQTRDVDYAGVLGSIGSSRASVLMETSLDDGVWVVLGAEVLPADDAPLLFLDTLRQTRKLRLTLKGTGAVPRISVVYAGKILVMPKPPEAPFKPLNLSRETVRKATMSRGGQFLGQEIQRRGMRGDVSFALLEAAWYRANFDPFVAAARRYPYFFAWQPEAYPKEVGYVWTEEDFAPPHTSFNLMSVAWSMQGIGQE